MSQERMKVLEMLAEGKISAADADRLLAKLEETPENAAATDEESRPRSRFLRIEVDGPDRDKVNVRVPMGFLRAGLKLGTVLPTRVRERLAARGIDLGEISQDDAEGFLKGLEELDVRIDEGDKECVRIYSE